MGNCQAAEAAAVVIQHPPGAGAGAGRVERAHGAISVAAVMAANPGHYVAAAIPASSAALPQLAAKAKPPLKLLRPDDRLALGGVYRLVSFEEVLREFVSKRHPTLSRVVVATDDDGARRRDRDCSLAKAPLPRPAQEEPASDSDATTGPEPDFGAAAMMLGGQLGLARPHGQWRPALPSIAEGRVLC
ncbi:uncharacterized protein LOC133907742 [Phragmites australis]|uniref:uncharacterized protein LOC133907742 n=1 Tax=Phragmites australis TaxID=29695 RepID=UPI002D780EB6|nr:uncharacterized protein LOC133907742 [Phragmites australis]